MDRWIKYVILIRNHDFSIAYIVSCMPTQNFTDVAQPVIAMTEAIGSLVYWI